ncbi:hypothetical protein ABIE65_005351 [Constrictibacter sp. MBR-5]|uniref:hypothetical protein n=1 Tax=Constrictibacter sp. MBR-5 TaxID=3156467 RepID=UPI0033962133
MTRTHAREGHMRITRRSFLLGSASTAALLWLPYHRLGAAAPPPLYDPALASATGAVEAISKLVSARGIIGLDFGDVRTVLNDGRGAYYGEGSATGQDRARVAAERALSDMRRSLAAARSFGATV